MMFMRFAMSMSKMFLCISWLCDRVWRAFEVNIVNMIIRNLARLLVVSVGIETNKHVYLGCGRDSQLQLKHLLLQFLLLLFFISVDYQALLFVK